VTDLVPGVQLSHSKAFAIVALLGEGGRGKIYKAYDPTMDRYVALKLLRLDVPDVVKRRFTREAKIAANFSHPNLVRVLDVGEMPRAGLRWIAMEYLRGRDLGQIIDKQRQVAWPLAVEMFRQTLDALHYVHTRRIAHCDIKPENIFATRDPYNRRLVIAKLIDFGICRNLDPPFELQQQISGDPRYMAPEQQVLNGPMDHRVDLYALGMTIYEVLTQRHPLEDLFERPIPELLAGHRERDPAPPSHYMPGGTPMALADAVDSLFFRACAKDPEDRFEDALEMQEAVVGLARATR
jgi:serine/threonine-protein kinase